jgi:Family of unknown function (DUF6599)
MKYIGLMTIMVLCLNMTVLHVSAADSDGISMLPVKNILKGWSLNGTVKQFTPQNLWEHVNGAAEQYIQYGFETLSVACYKKNNGAVEVSVELYTMKDPINGYGIYALERPENATKSDVEAMAYTEGSALNAWKGKYYLKLLAMSESGKDETVLKQWAESILKRYSGRMILPEIYKHFPLTGLVEGSFGYKPTGVMGIRDLNRGYSAEYKVGGTDVSVYLIRCAAETDVNESERIARKAVFSMSPVPPKSIIYESIRGVASNTKYRGVVWILRDGVDLLLISGTNDNVWVGPFTVEFFKNLHGTKTEESVAGD